MLNKVMIIGRLGRDPELRYSQSGSPVCTLNIATDESYTDRDGNRVDRAEWHRVVVFQKAAENCSQYLTKGNGGVVNSSRGILLAYKKQPGTAFDEAAYNECVNMKEAIAHACSLL